MIISFTGSQSGMTQIQKSNLLKTFIQLDLKELITGDCIGSDFQAAQIALEMGCKLFHLLPSTLTPKRAFAFPNRGVYSTWCEHDNGVKYMIEYPDKPLERNKKIVELGYCLIATPKEFHHTIRSGTWQTIRYAWKLKKDVIVIPPQKSDEELDENI